LGKFGLALVEPTTLRDLAVAVCSTVEGFWLNACLSNADPLGRDGSLGDALAKTLRLLVRGATVEAGQPA
jgi:hypothetical protein